MQWGQEILFLGCQLQQSWDVFCNTLCVWEELVLTSCSAVFSNSAHTASQSLSPPPVVCVCVYLYIHLIYIHLQFYKQLPQATTRCEQSRVQALGCDRQGPLLGAHLSGLTSSAATGAHLSGLTSSADIVPGFLLLRQGDRAGKNQVSASEIKPANHFLWGGVKCCNHPYPYVKLLLPLVHSPLSLIPNLHHQWIPFNTTNFCQEPHKIIMTCKRVIFPLLCHLVLFPSESCFPLWKHGCLLGFIFLFYFVSKCVLFNNLSSEWLCGWKNSWTDLLRKDEEAWSVA